MNKAMDFAQKGTPLEILSVTHTENVENYIFVEAFRKNSILAAISGLNCFLSKIDILSLNEMPKIYESSMIAQQNMPKSKSWVRIKGGMYDKDLAIIEKVISEDKIYVKLIPRIGTTKNGNSKQPFSRAPQRAFNSTLFSESQKVKPVGFNKVFW